MRSYHGRWKAIPSVVVNVIAANASKARYQIYLKAKDAGYEPRMPDIEVRSGQWLEGFSIWWDKREKRQSTEVGSQ